MLQPKEKLEARINLALSNDLYRNLKFRAEAAGVTVPEAIRQYLEIAVRDSAPNGAPAEAGSEA